MSWQHPARNDERLLTPRLELVPAVADDAEELTVVFGDERLYVFLASQPTTTEELRAQFARLAADRRADKEGTAQRNWTVRRHSDGRAVGMLQAVFSDQGRSAEIAWAVGVPWQRQGIASEAARAVVGWLERRGVVSITAHIHPDHRASAGAHPILAAWHEGPTARGRMALWADFMEAAGPLGQQQPALLHALPADAELTSHARVGPVLDWEGYAALWCFLAARDHRITRVAFLMEGIDPMQGMCALHDPDRGIAWIQMDGSVHVAGAPALLEESARLLREWETLGRPPIQGWRCAFAQAGPASASILTPRDWSLVRRGR